MSQKYYPPTSNALQKTLGAALDAGTTSAATFNNATGIQNKAGVFIVDRVDSNGTLKSSANWEWISFAGTSGSTVTTLVRGLNGSSDQDHAVGAIVEFCPDATWAQGVMDCLDNAFTAAAALDTTKVGDLTTAQTLTNKTLTTPVVASFYQDAGKTKLMTTPNTASDTLVALAATQTLTNKRITKRVVTTTDDATAVINTDITDIYQLSAVANATEFTLTGTPTDGQVLIVRCKDAGVGKGLTWTGFTAIGVTLPTTTVAGKWHIVGCIYNSAATQWQAVAVVAEA